MGVVYFSIIPTFEPSRYCKCWIVCFYYTIWFNNNKYENINNYYQLIKSFISFAMLQIGKQLIVCAIGKEVIFEFDEDMNKLLNNAL